MGVMFEKYPRYLQLAPTDETGTVQNTSNQRWKMATSGEETTGIFSNDPLLEDADSPQRFTML